MDRSRKLLRKVDDHLQYYTAYVITRKIINMFFCKSVKKLRMSGLWCYLEVHFSLVGLEFPDAFAVILHLSFILMHFY
jgi:hypothetical protein